ncbi:GAF sensor signal transduction histidine kinase [Halorubrum aidingense JCM 13560]|uniref:histidine kinase n=1 Tax=Halorubrum aidingense JCM 13560 TaxID=1230454 RepID=M0PPG9_9EURY|nr:ATP-binding protein [Halorubrum aidingense]EMA70780.1 GAF sensor signal transduction histidine kinase [Halorubrum aidingense JCM 13560]
MDSSQSVMETVQRLKPILRQEAPLYERVRDVLQIGDQYLDLERGYLSRVNEQIEEITVLASAKSTDCADHFGEDPEYIEPYCWRTAREDEIITLDNVSEAGWNRDVSEGVEPGCYIGTPIKVNKELYGILGFVGQDPRSESFSDTEILFVTLTAQVLERELVHQQFDSELTRETNRATVLNRVLRHNLRNDMTVIRGYTQLMAEKLEDDRLSATVLRHIDGLLELSQKARKLDVIINTESKYELTDITALVRDAADAVAESYPDTAIEVKADKPVRAEVMPSLARGLRELIENAAKHGGNSSQVTLTVDSTDSTVSIQISDTGPGLPDIEADVLTHGEELPLSHGRGLGLWTAYWIVTSHDGTIESSVSAEGTTLTVRLPRTAGTRSEKGMMKLQRARDRYEIAFEEAPDAMVFLNDDARILDANAETASVLGLSRKDLLGRSVRKFYQGPEEFETVWSEITNSEKSRDTVVIEATDGNQYVLEYSSKTEILPNQHFLINRVVENR